MIPREFCDPNLSQKQTIQIKLFSLLAFKHYHKRIVFFLPFTWECTKPCLKVLNWNFSRRLDGCWEHCYTLALLLMFIATYSFPMRYCMTLYLKGYQIYDRSKVLPLKFNYRVRNSNCSAHEHAHKLPKTQNLAQKTLCEQ